MTTTRANELTLEDLGWSAQAQLPDVTRALESDPASRPARVTEQGRDRAHVHDGTRSLLALLRSSEAPPVTGDWVLVRESGGSTVVSAVLPRRTAVARVVAGTGSQEQVLAANVDVVAICSPADNLNPRRLERELTAAWDSGARPICVVTKSDLVDDADAAIERLLPVAVGAEVVAVSIARDGGVEDLRRFLGAGTTMALMGPSGVGKSSLVNALAGTEVMATTAIRQDGKGRHTTTSRRLVAVAGGGLLLDTPGMREFAPAASPDALASAFPDIDDLAAGCRFADCRHSVEPGCAVQDAAGQDPAVAARLASWQSLQRELAWQARRSDARLMAEERRRWAILNRSNRHRIRP